MIRCWTWWLAALFLAAAPVMDAHVTTLYDFTTQTLVTPEAPELRAAITKALSAHAK